MAESIIYKNHCTPQEQADFTNAASTDRWYLDSDVGRKLTGICESKSTNTSDFFSGTIATTGENLKFIYIKNTDTSGSDYVLLNIGSMGAVIKLMPGESFASDVGETASDALTIAITLSGTPTYEWLVGS